MTTNENAISPATNHKTTNHIALYVFVFALAAVFGGVLFGSSDQADAHGPRYHNYRCPHVYHYQHGWSGIYTTAGMNFRSSDVCGGRHVKLGHVRVKQEGPRWRCQPYSDTGRRYTGTTWSHSTTWNWAHVSGVKDAALWGCPLTVYHNYWYY